MADALDAGGRPAAAIPEPFPFVDLQAQRRRLGTRLEAAIGRVLAHGRFVMGPEVAALEARLAAYCGVGHVITCASGTDALMLALMAWEIGPGDAVFVPSFSFVATAGVVALAGATPVFVDVDSATFNMDGASLRAAVAAAGGHGLRPAVVMPVDLFGQPADYRAIEPIAARLGLKVLVDAAQSFGASLDGRKSGSIGEVAVTSFYPSKPLGCYGDGGALFTDDDRLAAVLRSLRLHGAGDHRFDHVRVGTNSRLDTLQAAILLQKLAIFDAELGSRRELAAGYAAGLADAVETPSVIDGAVPAWANYTVKVGDRERLVATLADAGIPTAVYYPKPLHLQRPFRKYPRAPGGCPVAERLAGSVLSLPMHPYLDAAARATIVDAVRTGVA